MTTTPLPPAAPFDPAAPAPCGLTLLEASAGTGKTHCMTTLWLRLVLDEGLSPRAIAAVTFTRAAATELRLRLRRRLEAIRRDLAEGTPGARDDFNSNIFDCKQFDALTARVEGALVELDASPVGTIHQFARRCLRELALEPALHAEQLDERAFVTRVVDTFWARLCVDAPAALLTRAVRSGLGLEPLASLARLIVSQPLAPVLLDGGPTDALLAPARIFATNAEVPGDIPPTPPERLANAETLEELLACFVAEVRRALDRELSAGRASLPNATPELLLASLQQRDRGAERTAALRASYHAALVDEFQDTDATQWSLFIRLFGAEPPRGAAFVTPPADSTRDDVATPTRRLLLIGDPKQAIYAFRQADLRIWLAAERQVDHRRSLTVNRRSDAPLVAALNAVFDDPLPRAALAAQGLSYTPAVALSQLARERQSGQQPRAATPAFATAAPGDASHGASPTLTPELKAPAPLTVTLVTRPATGRAALDRQDAERLVLPAVTAAIASLEASGLLPPASSRARSLSALTVLVRSHRQLELVREALTSASIPCGATSASPLFRTEEAFELARVLAAVLAPQRLPLVRGALVTGLFGRTPRELAPDAPRASALLADTAETLRALQERWLARGFYAMFRELLHLIRAALAPRTPLSAATTITRLERLGALLHATATERPRTPARLLAWLEARLLAPPRDEEVDDLAPEGVRLVTLHAAKGLEFPFVLLPFAWTASYRQGARGLARITRDATHGRAIRVRLEDLRDPFDTGPATDAVDDPAHEELRLLYVGLTRARHGLTVFIPPQFPGWVESPLATLLGSDPEAPDLELRQLRPTLRRLDPQALRARLERRLPPQLATVRHLHVAPGELALDLDTLVASTVTPPPEPTETHSSRASGLAADTAPPPEGAPGPDAPTPTDALNLAPNGLEKMGATFFPMPSPTHAPSSDEADLDTSAAVGPAEFDAERGLGPRRWTRPTPLDTLWRRSSFSAIVRDFEAAARTAVGAALEGPEPPEPMDEPDAESAAPAAHASSPAASAEPDSAAAPRRPALADVPGGARLGNALHRVLEGHDLRDLSLVRLAAAASRALTDHGLDPSLAPALADALADALATPLPVEPPFRLADVSPTDRLSEVDFVLPLVGATRASATAQVEVGALAATLRTHAPRQLRPWLDALEHQPMRPLRGLLSGSIDAVLRAPDGRLFLVDWKSNHLGSELASYGPEALWDAMNHHHYHLQYLLYAVALRRHLRHRDPTTPAERFGGVLYCFLRGMHPDNPLGTGVFAFRPPEAMLDALEALLCPPLPRSPLG
jgi:exodeoxyribonuclease V beta subunit